MKGYIYLICDPTANTYKIGRTNNNVEKRLKQLQTGCSSELFVMDSFETNYPVQLERMLHKKFLGKKQLNEWFNLDLYDIKTFKDVCRHYEKIWEEYNKEEQII